MSLRVERHNANAARVAEWLSGGDVVTTPDWSRAPGGALRRSTRRWAVGRSSPWMRGQRSRPARPSPMRSSCSPTWRISVMCGHWSHSGVHHPRAVRRPSSSPPGVTPGLIRLAIGTTPSTTSWATSAGSRLHRRRESDSYRPGCAASDRAQIRDDRRNGHRIRRTDGFGHHRLRDLGELNALRDNAVLVLHALHGNSRVGPAQPSADTGWWDGLIGPGAPGGRGPVRRRRQRAGEVGAAGRRQIADSRTLRDDPTSPSATGGRAALAACWASPVRISRSMSVCRRWNRAVGYPIRSTRSITITTAHLPTRSPGASHNFSDFRADGQFP